MVRATKRRCAVGLQTSRRARLPGTTQRSEGPFTVRIVTDYFSTKIYA